VCTSIASSQSLNHAHVITVKLKVTYCHYRTLNSTDTGIACPIASIIASVVSNDRQKYYILSLKFWFEVTVIL
jgi:hypothetical protein